MSRSLAFENLGLGASIAVHVTAFVLLSVVPRAPAPAVAPSVVEFEVARPPTPKPEPEPELEPEPVRPVEPAPASRLKAEPAPTAPAAATPQEAEPAQAPVADLTGVTLTNDSGASWGSMVGDGRAMTRPIRTGRPAPPRAGNHEPASRVGRPAGPVVIPLADLSSRPVPPKLDAILQRHYPETARQQGKSGTAIVRLRIDADGQVRRANVVSESESGFGSACRTTVLGSRWSAPRDRDGKRVATFVSYTCRFRVDR